MNLLLLMFSVLIRQHMHNRFQTKDRVKEHIGKANILPVHFNVVLRTCFFPILVLLLFLHSKPSAVWLQGRVTVAFLMESFLGIWCVTEKKIILMETFYSKPYIGVLSRTFQKSIYFPAAIFSKLTGTLSGTIQMLAFELVSLLSLSFSVKEKKQMPVQHCSSCPKKDI